MTEWLIYPLYPRIRLVKCAFCVIAEVKNEMKCPPLTQLNGIFGVIKPRGLTAAKTCNQIRSDLTRGIHGHFTVYINVYTHIFLKIFVSVIFMLYYFIWLAILQT